MRDADRTGPDGCGMASYGATAMFAHLMGGLNSVTFDSPDGRITWYRCQSRDALPGELEEGAAKMRDHVVICCDLVDAVSSIDILDICRYWLSEGLSSAAYGFHGVGE